MKISSSAVAIGAAFILLALTWSFLAKRHLDNTAVDHALSLGRAGDAGR